MTEFYKICIVLEHCIPRLCNGSTSDSGSDCGGSNPPWGTTKRGCPERIIAVVNIIWQLSSLRTASFFWPLRITASTADSHSVNRSSILLGAINNNFETALLGAVFFILNEPPRIELRKERLQKGEQCAAFLLSNYPNRLKYDIIVSMNKNGNEENPALLESYDELCGLLLKIKDKNELKSVFNCLFTPNERRDFAERWQVVKELKAGTTQREIARKYNMSLCKITRGSKELQKSGSGFLRLLELLKD